VLFEKLAVSIKNRLITIKLLNLLFSISILGRSDCCILWEAYFLHHHLILYDKITYIQRKAELKTLGSPSIETVAKQLSSGSEQSSNVVLDIMGKISKRDLIKGIRSGWGKNTRIVLLNYKGKWYQIDKVKASKDSGWMEKHIK
jgi:hypothetical protein